MAFVQKNLKSLIYAQLCHLNDSGAESHMPCSHFQHTSSFFLNVWCYVLKKTGLPFWHGPTFDILPETGNKRGKNSGLDVTNAKQL